VTAATLGGVELAALWRVLSLGFTAPSAESVAEVEALADGLVAAGTLPEVAAVLTVAQEEALENLSSQYAALFRGTVRVAPYEGSYELDPVRQGRQMADVAAFYLAFGAEAHGPVAERPDFAGCELEFLAFLELKRLDVEDDADLALLDEIAASFLRDHAGRWLPTFFAEVRAAAPDAPFYEALAALGARVLEDELARRGVEPSPLPRRHRRGSVEDDSFECGAGATTTGPAARTPPRPGA
jgi:TorA maturation chaperone TorD